MSPIELARKVCDEEYSERLKNIEKESSFGTKLIRTAKYKLFPKKIFAQQLNNHILNILRERFNKQINNK